MADSLPGSADTDWRLNERWRSLADVMYLSQVNWLYVFSALYPAIGLFCGVLFLTGSISQRAKRIGGSCLILGAINAAAVLLAFAALLALGPAGTLAGLGKD